jgi:hypothetical protein
MVTRIVIACLTTTLLVVRLATASPFVEGNTHQKNEPKPVATAPRPQLPTVPLPPLPSSHQGSGTEMPKRRWDFVGKIDNRVIVTDTLSGEILSLTEGESLPGGCVATSGGVYCGKDATEKKRAPRAEVRTVDPAHRLDELIFSAQSIAQKCIQLDDTLKSEIVKTNLVLKDRDAELTLTKQELQTQKQIYEQLKTEQIAQQNKLLKTQAENTKIKDDTAFLLTTIALMKHGKSSPYQLPGAEGRIFKGTDGGTTILLNLKDAAESSLQGKSTEQGTPADTMNRRDK